MPLVNMVDAANLTRLQRYVRATTLVPGDDAAVSAREANNLASAIKAFAEAGAQKDAAEQAVALLKAYEGTRWHAQVESRVRTLLKQWHFEKLIDEVPL
jgi:LPS sulfotransferase NodH